MSLIHGCVSVDYDCGAQITESAAQRADYDVMMMCQELNPVGANSVATGDPLGALYMVSDLAVGQCARLDRG